MNPRCGRTRRQAYEAAAAKEMGNRLFKAGRFAEAEEKFTQSLAAHAMDATVHTNRSAARAARGDWEGALDDALVAVELDAHWTKVRLSSPPGLSMRTLEIPALTRRGARCDASQGHYRCGLSYMQLSQSDKAVQVIGGALSAAITSMTLANLHSMCRLEAA